MRPSLRRERLKLSRWKRWSTLKADAYGSSDEEDYGAGYGYSEGAAGVGDVGHGEKEMDDVSSGTEDADDSSSSGGDYDSDQRAERHRGKTAKKSQGN